jgi:hypothetical protein
VSRVSGPDNGPSVDHGVDTGSGHDPTDLPRLRQFAAEQAALRRVATLIANGAQPEVFTAVADELAGLVGAEAAFVSPQTPHLRAPTLLIACDGCCDLSTRRHRYIPSARISTKGMSVRNLLQ